MSACSQEQTFEWSATAVEFWPCRRYHHAGQPVDAATGSHVWGVHYGRELKVILAVQNEITYGIVATVAAELVTAAVQRATHEDERNIGARDFRRGY